MDGVEKLELTPYEAFHSSLKKGNMVELDYEAWLKHRKGPAPKMGPEIYEGMQTFKDYLTYCNNLDVGPFVKAMEKMLEFYRSKNINLFKITISIPGMVRQLLHRTSKENRSHFALLDRKNKDLYQTLKTNLKGGPSVVFHHQHVQGQTLLRGTPVFPVSCGPASWPRRGHAHWTLHEEV